MNSIYALKGDIHMDDSKIVDLYWQRSENALTETESKYKNYCYNIAFNILENKEDANECVNDTYLRAWNSMPTHRPERLSTFLGKITRNLALTCFQKRNRQKRGLGQVEIALSELEECISNEDFVTKPLEVEEIAEYISKFLYTLPAESRIAFIGRYWRFYSISTISNHLGFSESKTKSLLHRTRIGLKSYFKKVGIEI